MKKKVNEINDCAVRKAACTVHKINTQTNKQTALQLIFVVVACILCAVTAAAAALLSTDEFFFAAPVKVEH